MKKYLFSLIMLMMTVVVFAQPGRGEMMQERVESQRVAFITQQLQLTPDESAKFWPLYNEYQSKRQLLTKAARTLGIETGQSYNAQEQLTDDEAEGIIELQFQNEENLLKLKREYYSKFKSAIPASKIARLSPVEMEFNRTVLEKIRERMEERRN
jgi:hypothetical protein